MASEVMCWKLGRADGTQRAPWHLLPLGVLSDATVARGQLPEVGLQGSFLCSADIWLLSGVGRCK